MAIRWTKPAAADFTRICDYTLERFGAAQARHTALEIYGAADSLDKLPNRGRSGRHPGTRELVIAGLPFLIVYRVRQGTVEITRILHGAQKWP